MKTESSKEMLGKLEKPPGEMGSQHSKSCSSSSAIALLSLVLNLNTTNHTEDAIVMGTGSFSRDVILFPWLSWQPKFSSAHIKSLSFSLHIPNSVYMCSSVTSSRSSPLTLGSRKSQFLDVWFLDLLGRK